MLLLGHTSTPQYAQAVELDFYCVKRKVGLALDASQGVNIQCRVKRREASNPQSLFAHPDNEV